MKKLIRLLALIMILGSLSSTMALAQDQYILSDSNHDACNEVLECLADKVIDEKVNATIGNGKNQGQLAFSVVLDDSCALRTDGAVVVSQP